MKIKMITSVVSTAFEVYNIGQVLEVKKDISLKRAKELIKNNLAEEVKEENVTNTI